LFYFAALILWWAVTHRQGRLLTADSVFVISLTLMATGTFLRVDPDQQVDVLYAQIFLTSSCIYLGSSAFFAVSFGARSPREAPRRVIDVDPSTVVVRGLIFISVVVTIAYFYSIGYSALYLSFRSLTGADPADVASLRLNSYSGAKYFFPGYVNQFKNVILPAMTAVIVTSRLAKTSELKSRRLRFGEIVLVVLAPFALLGTGQRGPFFIFAAVLAVFLYLRQPRGIARRIWVLGGATVAIGLGATLALQRGGNALAAASGSGKLQGLVTQLSDRFLFSNQESGIAGFRYTSHFAVADGHEWLQGMAGLLPGSRGSDLSGQIFASIFGGSRGTAPPSLWGSVAYNFGVSGVVLFPILLALILQVINQRSLRKAEYNSLEIMGLAGIFVIFGTWTNGGPIYLMNAGLASYTLIWAIGRALRRKASKHGYDAANIKKVAGAPK